LKAVARCMAADHNRGLLEGKQEDCGQDAFFVARATPDAVSIGVADGVGGWSKWGVDPGAFSRELMRSCQAVAESQQGRPADQQRRFPLRWLQRARRNTTVVVRPSNPITLLETGYETLRAKGEAAPAGSATACLASLDRHTGLLKIANLGDSGALVIRGDSGHCVMASSAMQHTFNQPYQLTMVTESFKGKVTGDSPRDADLYAMEVREGDLVVLATDGVFDNLSTEDIVEVATASEGAEPEEIADRLLKLARARSTGRYETPFSLASRLNGDRYYGGKPDDITVVVARIARAPEEP